MDTGYSSQTQLVLDTKRQGLPGIWILVRHNQVWIQGDKVYQVYGYQLATTSLDTGRQGLPGIWILVRHNQFWIQGDKVYQVYGYQLDTTSSGFRETRSTRCMDTSQTQLVLDTGRQGLSGIWILVRHNQFWIQGDPRTKINIESLVLS